MESRKQKHNGETGIDRLLTSYDRNQKNPFLSFRSRSNAKKRRERTPTQAIGKRHESTDGCPLLPQSSSPLKCPLKSTHMTTFNVRDVFPELRHIDFRKPTPADDLNALEFRPS